jgi:2'-5' RNA ligase
MSRETWRTAVLLALPELAGYTDRWRTASYSRSRPELSIAERIPPHVTVLIPWAADPDDAVARERLAAAVAGLGALELSFPEADVFASGTVYLRPEPFGLVLGLLRAVYAAFPEHAPYGGEYPDPHPHLTVSGEGGEPVLAQVRAALAEGAPPAVRVDELTIWASSDGGIWHRTGSVPLAP